MTPPSHVPHHSPANGTSAGGSLRSGTIRGYRVLMAPSRSNEIASLAAFFPAGGAHDAPGKAGALGLALALLNKGTVHRDALALAEAIEDLGSSVGGHAFSDFSKFSLSASSLCFDQTLDLWAESLFESSFPEDEVEKERDLLLAGLRMEEDDTFSFTYRRFVAALFRGTPYEHPVSGTIDTASTLTRDDLTAVWRTVTERAGGVVVAVGNFDADRLAARLEALLPEPTLPALAPVSVAPPPAGADTVHDKECEQAFLCVGAPTVPFIAPDYPATRVLSCVLGEGMGSRMFIRLRDEKGLAYATGASSSPERACSHLFCYIGTKPERVGESREGIAAILDEARRVPPSTDELRRAKNYIAGRFLFDHQKNSRRAQYLGFFEMMGAGYDYDAQFVAGIEAVTAEDVRAAADRYLAQVTTTELRPETAPLSR